MSEQFEHKMKQLLGDIEFEPRDAVWSNLRNDLHPGKKKRRLVFWWLLPLALAGGILTYVTTQDEKNELTKSTQPGTPRTTVQPKTDIPVQAELRPLVKTSTVRPVGPVFPGQNLQAAGREFRAVRHVQGVKPAGDELAVTATRIDRPTVPAGNEVAVTAPRTDRPTVPAGATGVDSSTAAPGAALPPTAATTAAEKLPSDTQAIVTQAAPVKVKTTRKWRFGVSAEAGFVGLTSGLPLAQQKDMVLYTGTGPGGVLSSATAYQRTSYGSNLLWGVGLTVQYAPRNKTGFRAGLGYQHYSIGITKGTYKDSVMGGVAMAYVISTERNEYRFQSINLSTVLTHRFFSRNGMDLEVGAGLDNQIVMSAQNRQKVYTAGGTSASRARVLSKYHSWQPQLNLQLSAQFQSRSGKTLQLIPQLRYGLSAFEKQTNARKNHQAYFGLGVNYFFR